MSRHDDTRPSAINGDGPESLEAVVKEYLDRLNDGEKLDPFHVLAEHPENGREILDQLQMLITLESALSVDAPLGTLGDYTLRRQIGRGGMGVVYEAWQGSMDRQVALKVLPAGLAADEKTFTRFMREAKTAGKLDHPNVVGVHAAGFDENTPYYAMEYVAGETLAQILAKIRDAEPDTETPFGPRDQVDYFARLARAFADVADGLQHAHSKGVIHRDIKPSNLILNSEGKLRILDFGLARLEGQESLTLSGDLMGTVLYMSPEQAMAKRIPLDHRTDVYSLGATIYEVLTGQPPFRGKDQHDTLSQIMVRDPRPLRQLNPRLPVDLETIVLKCLRKDASDRYGTAEALAQDLRRFVRGDPIEARPQPGIERLAGSLRRHGRTLALLTPLVLLLVYAGWLFYDRKQKELQILLDDYEPTVRQAVTKMYEGKFSLGSSGGERRDLGMAFGGWGVTTVSEDEFRILWKTGRSTFVADAIRDLEEVAKRLPNRRDAHYHLARAYALVGRDEEARHEIDRTLRCEKDFLPAKVLEWQLMDGDEARREASFEALRAALEPRNDWQSQWLTALRSMRERKWRKAAEAYGELLDAAQKSGEPYIGLSMEALIGRGAAWMEARDYVKAREDFAIAQYLAKASLEPALLRARACYLSGDRKLAGDIMMKLYRSVPPGVRTETVLLITAVYDSLDAQDEALKWIGAFPNASTRDRLSCIFHWRKGRIDEAIKAGRRAIAGDREDPIAHLLLGRALLQDFLLRESPAKVAELLQVARRAAELNSPGGARYLLKAAEAIRHRFEPGRTSGRSRKRTLEVFSHAPERTAGVHGQRGFFDDARVLGFSNGNDIMGSVACEGRELYFESQRPPSFSWDVWCARREGDDDWSVPMCVHELNTADIDAQVTVAPDGLEAFFFRGHPPPAEVTRHLYTATRREPGAPWEQVRRLEIDSDGLNMPGSLSSDGLTFYFCSDRPVDDFGVRNKGGWDVFVASRPAPGEPFAGVRNLEEINTGWDEVLPTISADGLTIFWSDFFTLSSPRPGGAGDSDIWMATRPTASDPFGPAMNVGAPVNSETTDAAPWVSVDWPAPGSRLYFSRGTRGDDSWLWEVSWHPDSNGDGVDDRVDIAGGRSAEAKQNNEPDGGEDNSTERR